MTDSTERLMTSGRYHWSLVGYCVILIFISILLHISSLSKGILKTAPFWLAVFIVCAIGINSATKASMESVMFERNKIETSEQNIGSVEKSAASVMESLSRSINSNNNSAVLHASAVIGMLDPFTTLSEKEEGIRSYKIKRGDTISWIAKQFGISIETVKAANPGIGSRLTPGKTLAILPVSGIVYRVSEKDSLELIVERYNADQNLIKVYNPSYADIFASGQGTLILPNVSTQVISQKPASVPVK